MSGRLPAWFADWLGVPVPTDADSATWQLDSRWSWAPWATLLLVLVAIAWTVLLYARESGSASRLYRVILAALRLATIALVLVMLAQWALALWLTGPPSIAIVVDHSASMGIVDRYDDAALSSRVNEQLAASGLKELSRLNLVKLLLKEENGRLLEELSNRYRVAGYQFAANIERIAQGSSGEDLKIALQSLTADGRGTEATRVGDGLKHVLDDYRGAPPAAVVLFSDGVVTDGSTIADAAQDMRSAGVPLFAVGLGSSKPPRDIELADVLVDDAIFVNDLVNLQVQIKASGFEGHEAKITLRRDGETKPLAEQSVALPSVGKTLTVQLTDRPTRAGDVTYVVETAPRDDEIDQKNNRQTRTVSVRDEKIRVLLAYGYPSYEFRFLKSLLERDNTVQLSTYLQDADPEYAEQDKTALRSFPVNRDDLFSYDVLIIGDIDPRLLPQSVWQQVRAFVAEKGGGAAFIAGPKYLPVMIQDNADVGALLPINVHSLAVASDSSANTTPGFAVRPTPLGLQNPAMQLGDSSAETQQIWGELAPLFWLAPVGELKPGAQILAEAAGKPAISFQYFGAGRVVFQAIDSTWRWRAGVGESYFARYWVQMIRFLAHGKLGKGRGVQLTTDRREYHRGETAQLRARFLDNQLAPNSDEIVVMVNAVGQPRRRVTLRRNPAAAGVYEGSLAGLADGQYELQIVEPQLKGNAPATKFSVVAPPGEFARTEMDAKAMSAAADVTRGKFFTISDADKLLDSLPRGRRVPIQNLPSIPIWNRWWLLAAFLSCITTEWILRKRKGML
jgi:von Willebrand factor type A domain